MTQVVRKARQNCVVACFALAVATKIRAEKRAAFAPSITLATISTWNLVFDPPACSPRRFENFLPGGAAHDAMYCVKGQKKISPAISKTFFKNARIGTRTHMGEEGSQPGIEPTRDSQTLVPTPVAQGFRGPGEFRYEHTKSEHPTQ